MGRNFQSFKGRRLDQTRAVKGVKMANHYGFIICDLLMETDRLSQKEVWMTAPISSRWKRRDGSVEFPNEYDTETQETICSHHVEPALDWWYFEPHQVRQRATFGE